EGLSAGTGTGYSKKESQQNAAQMALKKIKNDNDFMEEILAAKEQNSPAEVEEVKEEMAETEGAENTEYDFSNPGEETEKALTAEPEEESSEANPHSAPLNH
ncbi:putative dsRNA-binding protein, partial [Bacteroides heparinolyticus]